MAAAPRCMRQEATPWHPCPDQALCKGFTRQEGGHASVRKASSRPLPSWARFIDIGACQWPSPGRMHRREADAPAARAMAMREIA